MKNNKRKNARKITAQAMYSWQVNTTNIKEIQQYYLQENSDQRIDEAYFMKTIKGVTENIDMIDKKIQKHIDIDEKRLGIVEQAILRISIYELILCPMIPYKVIINEAVELSKEFGASQSYKFINGVLDKLINSENQNLILKQNA